MAGPLTVRPRAAVVGAGPAGLMAAEVLAEAGAAVDVYDAMPSAGRKFLLAGIGGLNITHSEPPNPFLPATAIVPASWRRCSRPSAPRPCGPGRRAWE